MCYWYANSTFEVLTEIGKATVHVENSQKWGVLSWSSTNHYTGVTRKSWAANTGNVGPESTQSTENDPYREELVELEGRYFKKYDGRKSWTEEDLAQVPMEERPSIKKTGWNVMYFIKMIKEMPSHKKLLDDSVARSREVWDILEKVCYIVSFNINSQCLADLSFSFLFFSQIDSKWPGGGRSSKKT